MTNPNCSICKGEGVFYEHSTVETCWCSLPSQIKAERDVLAELEALRIQVSTLTEWYSNALDVIREVSAAIHGVTYMDPPDGGDVSIPEQIRRMAKDAELYRWVSSGVQEAETLVSVVVCHGGDSRKVAERIAVYMEANQEAPNA